MHLSEAIALVPAAAPPAALLALQPPVVTAPVMAVVAAAAPAAAAATPAQHIGDQLPQKLVDGMYIAVSWDGDVQLRANVSRVCRAMYVGLQGAHAIAETISLLLGCAAVCAICVDHSVAG
jgi:hypothetical protein